MRTIPKRKKNYEIGKKKMLNVWTKICTAQANKRENIKAASARRKICNKSPERKTFLFIERDQIALLGFAFFPLLLLLFFVLTSLFFGLIVHNFVYINYEERQQGITRMNVVACGNKKHNKRWMDVKWIEQGSSERAAERAMRCNK